MRTITLIPGDGIGPSVTEAAVKVVEATGVEINWEKVDAGITALEKFGDPLPKQIIESIKRNGIALKGPIGTPIGQGYSSIEEFSDTHRKIRERKSPLFIKQIS